MTTHILKGAIEIDGKEVGGFVYQHHLEVTPEEVRLTLVFPPSVHVRSTAGGVKIDWPTHDTA